LSNIFHYLVFLSLVYILSAEILLDSFVSSERKACGTLNDSVPIRCSAKNKASITGFIIDLLKLELFA
jgi:hypothetical protein